MILRRALIVSLLLASTAAVCPAAPAQLEVTAVRFWTLSEVTRIAVETNGEFRFRSDRLYNPERLFFDLLATKPRMGVKGVHVTPVGDKLLKRIRVAETQPGMTRVVLDLETAVEFTASQLSNPDRLMIELRPATASLSRHVSENKPPTTDSPKPGEAAVVPIAAAPVLGKPTVPEKLLIEEKRGASKPAPPTLTPPPPLAVRRTTEKPLIDNVGLKTAPPAPTPPTEEKPVALKPAPPALAPPPALAAKRMVNGDRTLIRALGLKVGRIVIDPGHGGHDQGSTGRGGLMEKELVLDVAQRLGALIEERLGSEVIYTRFDDTFIPLESRTELANEKNADLFLSIHANSSPYPSVSGVETYYLNFSSTRDELDLASRENAGSQKTIHELGDLLQKISRHDKAEESREFASKMQAALYGAATRSNSAAKNRGVKRAPFVVLIGATMPSILAEIGFVSNSREETLLKKSEHRQRLAEALFRGLSRYAETLSHFQITAKN
jgi:N-acetylmuramoyl-L-alanine amidase